jgi:hypothetical protein
MNDDAVGFDDRGIAAVPWTPPSGATWRDVDRRMRRLAARRGADAVEEAALLLAAERAGVHVYLGMASFVEYVERVLGYRPRTTLDRLRVARALEDLPATRAALAAGTISYSAVRELTRVASATDEAAWLARVADRTIREIEAMIAGRASGSHPDDPPDPERESRTLRLALPPHVYAMFLETRRHVETETGQRLSDGDLVAAICERALGTHASPPGDEDVHRAPYQVALTRCDRCDRAWQDADGQVLEVAPAVAAAAACDADEVGQLGAPEPPAITTTIPPRIRRAVLRRDHHRCTIPGCRRARNLHIHHIEHRADGGGHCMSNLTTCCSTHHLAHHDGRLVIAGQAPDRLRFIHADGRPYGSAPTPADELYESARVALCNLEHAPSVVAAALETVRAHMGAGATLDEILRAGLRACTAKPASRRQWPRRSR